MISPDTYQTPGGVCPSCGVILDRATETFAKGAPGAGDLSCCLLCGALSVFQDDGTLRAVTPEEEAEALMREDVLIVRDILDSLKEDAL